jgi:hypothetical protein
MTEYTIPRVIETLDFRKVKEHIEKKFTQADRSRMLARLLENQPLDAWMTHELMETAIDRFETEQPFGIVWRSQKEKQTRDQRTSTTADELHLNLRNSPVDSFFNFQNIYVQGQVAMRHINRPDGMFLLELDTTSFGAQQMVLFYEGDVHKKDAKKTLYEGCRNSHKMYQAIAQAQSNNRNMAGCAIFAAMDDAPTDDLMPFLDDMLKAHIFVCIAIADWNAHIYVKSGNNRKTTMIGSFFKNSLNASIDYDFVFGINIGMANASPGFEETDYTHRIRVMLNGMGYIGADILLENELQGVAAYDIKSSKIGMVQIVICAIPRQKKTILASAPRMPMFIYPFNMDELVKFTNNTGTLQNMTLGYLNMVNVAGANIAAPFHFKQNMMDKTAVEMNAAPAAANLQRINVNDTNGFFFIALPLAYYTIQQFECVNSHLNYEWSTVRFNVRTLINKLKKNKQNLTGVTNVTMFTKNKSSLFQVICASVDCKDVEPLAKDFNVFLEKVCRWRETPDNTAPGSSPKVIFRTLGIFSLQNAIDFACEMKANPNKTYLSLLASYPAGTQMVIQQCMKKLSSNEAYAWVLNEDGEEKTAKPPAKTDEQDSDDDDDGNTFADKLLNLEQQVITSISHSSWFVKLEPKDATVENVQERADAMAASLLRALTRNFRSWKIDNLGTIKKNESDIEPEESLRKELENVIQGINIYNNEEETETVNAKIPVTLFCPGVSYCVRWAGHNFSCKVVCPEILKVSYKDLNVENEADGKRYEICWQNVKISFTLEHKNTTDRIKTRLQEMQDSAVNLLNKFMYGDNAADESELKKIMDEIKKQKTEQTERQNLQQEVKKMKEELSGMTSKRTEPRS